MAGPSRVRSPWTAGALLLALGAGLVSPLLYWLGLHAWPLAVGALALLLLLFGALERLWQRRALPGPPAPRRGGFRVLTGGKGKGNGQAEEPGPGEDPGDDDKPRWVM
jgi:protein-S-isoprenylcysteine O-methyltransferase Ste14